MIVYAGIDEAGYGPMLGPLCVGASAFTVHLEQHPARAPDLWAILSGAVCRSPRDRRRRVAIEDSKKLKGPAGSGRALAHLERGVLAFCRVAGITAQTDEELMRGLGVPIPDLPWYESTSALPLENAAGEVRIASAVVRRISGAAGVGCALLACEALSEETLNRRVRATGSKAAVNLGCVVRLIDQMWRRFPEHLRVIVDRQGGRIRYLRALRVSFPGSRIRVVAESPRLSRYRLEREGSTLSVSFLPAAEGRHLPVALGSMIAKYVRELLMLRLNRFFQARLPDLRPTAGYVSDARRFLAEVEPVLERMDLPRRRLIRTV